MFVIIPFFFYRNLSPIDVLPLPSAHVRALCRRLSSILSDDNAWSKCVFDNLQSFSISNDKRNLFPTTTNSNQTYQVS